MKMLKFIIVCLTISYFSVSVYALTWANIDLENATVYCGTSQLYDDSQYFNLELEGDDYNCPWITGSSYYDGNYALGMRLYPDSDNYKDRTEITACHMTDSYALKFGKIRYFGFAMCINNSSSDWPLDVPVHFMQAWQANSGMGCGVPLHCTLETDTVLRFHITGRDDAGAYALIPSTEISKGYWHTFVFRLAPNHNQMTGTGNVKVWYDGNLLVDWNHDWGCEPQGVVTDDWMIRCGLYRGESDNNLVAIFDNVRIASSVDEATP